MSEIQTADKYVTSTVDEIHLDSIKEDLGETELVGYQHHPEEKAVTCILFIGDLVDLRYIQ